MTRSSLKYWAILAVAIALPLVLSNVFHRNLLFLSCVFAIFALSGDIVFGGMGQFTFGHQAFFGIGAYTSAKLALDFGATPLLGFLAAFILSGVLGLFVGYVCLRRLRTMYLALVTFGLGAMLFLIARNWYEFTGGLTGIGGVPVPRLFGFKFRSELSYYYLALAILLVTIYFIHRFWRSRMGRAIIALRENEAVANSVGIPPTYYYSAGFGFACGFAGLSGAVYVHSTSVVSPGLFHFEFMVILLISLLVGGMGTIEGPVLGAIIYVWLSELLRFSDELRYIILGAVLLGFILFMPSGVYPALVSLWSRFRGEHARGEMS